MKKGIEIWCDYDRTGVWCLRIKKKKGKLTLEEIREEKLYCKAACLCASQRLESNRYGGKAA